MILGDVLSFTLIRRISRSYLDRGGIVLAYIVQPQDKLGGVVLKKAAVVQRRDLVRNVQVRADKPTSHPTGDATASLDIRHRLRRRLAHSPSHGSATPYMFRYDLSLANAPERGRRRYTGCRCATTQTTFESLSPHRSPSRTIMVIFVP